MRFVRIKSAEQQGQLMQHRTRDVLIRQRTQMKPSSFFGGVDVPQVA
jgi:transposase